MDKKDKEELYKLAEKLGFSKKIVDEEINDYIQFFNREQLKKAIREKLKMEGEKVY